MSKKILVLTGSPNRDGNTNKMADAFIRGAERAGHKAIKFEAAFKNLRGFTAATERDDFSELELLLNSCDVIAIATPLYWFSFPAQLKAVIDQLDATPNNSMTIRESYLLVSGGETEREIYLPIESLYRTIGEFLGWQERGILQAGGLDDRGAIDRSGLLARAEEMGKNA